MTTPNTTASGAADDSLLICASDLQHSAIYDNLHEMVDCVRAVADRITALAASAPVAPTQPDWRELCRRLYVELFHCDKQMTCSLNEDGEPIWRTGQEVRDVLSDAKAALEANPITPEAAPVAPAPQPAVPDGFVLVPVEPTPEMVRAAYSSPIQGGLEAIYANMLAAAPKAAPAINKVSDIIDAYGMTPGQPERVADIPGLAEALEAAFADGSAQITGATPLQQGEHPPLPVPSGRIEYPAQRYENAWVSTQDAYSEEQMHAYVDADRAARGAAQAAPVKMPIPPPPVDPLDVVYAEGWNAACEAFFGGRLAAEPLVITVTRAAPAPVAEDVEIRKALDDAATALETISRIAGRDQYMLGMMDVRLYAAARAKAAREAQAAQPEGGAKHG